MAWNEPGGGRDPWGGRGDQQGPPDLEEAIKNLQAKVSRIFGGGKSIGGGGGGRLGSMGIAIIIIIALGLWAVFSFYVVEPAEEGVVTRFGKYVRTAGPGLNWRPLFIEDVEIIDVKQVRNAEIGFRSAGRSAPA